MNYYIKFLQISLCLTLSIFILLGCNKKVNNNIIVSNINPYFKGMPIVPNKKDTGMRIEWSLDSRPLKIGADVSDMAWHLITLKVVGITKNLATPIALKGLQYAIYPSLPNDKNAKVEITDINCQNAQFSKFGDTCSAYIRVLYNPLETSDLPLVPVQITTNAYPSLFTMQTLLYFRLPLSVYPQVNYRVVLPIESSYYAATKLLNVANKEQYQIISMKNVSLPKVMITNITNLTNREAFTLINRQDNSPNDPYYGSYDQCSPHPNFNKNQVDFLLSLESECILIYRATLNSNQAIQTDRISLETNANANLPWWTTRVTKTLKLQANYDALTFESNQKNIKYKNLSNFKILY